MPQTTAERTRTHRSRVAALEARVAAIEGVALVEADVRLTRLELHLAPGGPGVAGALATHSLSLATDVLALRRASEIEADPRRLDAACQWAAERGLRINGLDHSL